MQEILNVIFRIYKLNNLSSIILLLDYIYFVQNFPVIKFLLADNII